MKYKDYESFLEYKNFNDDLIEYKRWCFIKNYEKRVLNTYKFFKHDTLLLQKRVYHYEYMDDWEKLNEISLPEKYFTET